MANQLAGIQWERANPYGIAIDEANSVWHSAHITDVLELNGADPSLLVATETGGVWTIAPNGQTVSLSESWDNPDVNCLAFGPDGDRHVYAGCDTLEPGPAAAGVIMETDITQALPLLNWRPIAQPLPAGAGDVNRILVLNRHRKIVAACDGGIFWSDIPQASPPRRGCLGVLFPWTPGPAPQPAPYVWTRAAEEDYGQSGYYDAAIGSLSGRTERPGEEDLQSVSIVAGGNNNGIFFGLWDANNTLTMRRSRAFDDQGRDMTPLYFGRVSATSVASCEIRPTRLYAASANPDGILRFVFRSSDGGRSWTTRGDDLRGSPAGMRITAGDGGNDWNNCIAVMPDGPGIVAVGWREGTFLSVDEGKSWMQILNSPHLHKDVHALKFKPAAGADERFLYIGSDGGLAQVKTDDVLAGVAPPWCRSDYNRLMPTHQCYATLVTRQFYGTLAASPTNPGLVSTGVQDNGNIAAFTGPGIAPWVQIASGDGGWNGIVADGGLVHSTMDGPVQAHRQQGGSFISLGVPPITVPPPVNPSGVSGLVGDVVRRPSFRNDAGQTMYAVAGTGPSAGGQVSLIYGLFADTNAPPPLPYHWELLGSLAADVTITAVASLSGSTIFVGAAGSRIFAFDSAQGTAVETPVELPRPYPNAVRSGGGVTRIMETPDHSAFALLNSVTFSSPPMAIKPKPKVTAYYILRLDGLKWVPTPWMAWGQVHEMDTFLYGLDVVTATRPHTVFVSTDNHIYGSIDDGNTWQLASQGLPRRPHCTDLRYAPGFGRQPGWLYLGTYGRSVWRANMGHFQG